MCTSAVDAPDDGVSASPPRCGRAPFYFALVVPDRVWFCAEPAPWSNYVQALQGDVLPVEAGRAERVWTDLDKIIDPMSTISKPNTMFDYLVLLFLAGEAERDDCRLFFLIQAHLYYCFRRK